MSTEERRSAHAWLPGVHAAPNIQGDVATYEIENRALDPDGLLFEAMERHADWSDRVVVDLGAGTAFWCERFARTARHVYAVEPHGPSRVVAMARAAGLSWSGVSVVAGSAERTMLASDSVDLVHARFAYFWGPGCEPGLAELERIVRPGGWAFIIDNDLERGDFAAWLAQLPDEQIAPQPEREAFWAERGFSSELIMSRWSFETRADLEAVARLEFGAALGAELAAAHQGLDVSYGYRLYAKQF